MTTRPNEAAKRIAELEAEVGLYAGADQRQKLHISSLQTENQRLTAIVERLPKTKDGIPIVPGMKLWHPDQATTRCIYPFESDGVWLVDVPTKIGPDNFVCQSSHENATDCYSTRQAAESKPVNTEGT